MKAKLQADVPEWECPSCNYENRQHALRCAKCGFMVGCWGYRFGYHKYCQECPSRITCRKYNEMWEENSNPSLR